MKENKKELILNSAEEIMCRMEDPISDITVEMIAKNAGIGKGSIYYYFKSKDEIIDAVIERSYSIAIREFFDSIKQCSDTFEKLKMLFRSILKKEFNDNRKNVIISLHVQDNLVLHHKMMITAIKTVSPILTEILNEGRSEGFIHTDSPKESAEMIVAMLTFLLDNSFFPADNESMYRKLKLYARVLETSLMTKEGRFNFLFSPPDN